MNYFKNNWFTILLIVIIIYTVYELFGWCFKCIGCEERIYNFVRMNDSDTFKKSIVMIADKIMAKNDLFHFNFPTNTKFKSIFTSSEEKDKVKIEARNFFKNTFGLSDSFLKIFMWELRVNDEVGYRILYDNTPIIDGGYVCYVPAQTTLRGPYGGKKGVTLEKPGTLAYGYYIGGGYKIRYWSMCPLTAHSTYDGIYTPIDCDLEIEDAPDKKLIGLKGKAIGVYKSLNYKGLSNHITIRNVMTFF